MALLAALVWTSARAQSAPQILHNHVRPAVTTGKARPAGAMPEDQKLSFSIVLPLRDEAGLTQFLSRLYDPSSPDYRKFLTVAEFTQRYGPTADDYAKVVAFTKANGLQTGAMPANRLIVPASGTVDAINKAFHVRMGLYQHPTENRVFFSPDREPSLALTVPVAHIAGLNNYALPKPHVKQSANAYALDEYSGSGPQGLFLASDMRAAYYGATQLTGNGQAVGLVEWGGYYLSDVNATFASVGQSYAVPVNNVLLDGAIAEPLDGLDDGEQVLDIVQAIGMAPGLSQVRVYVGNGPDDANILSTMASENIAKVLSCSWSWVPEDATTDDVFFKEFAAQGQTFLAASGDLGAFDADIDPYFYPQEDQNVTAVGGTHLSTLSPGGAWSGETAWNVSFAASGGGVSPDGIPLPAWQTGLANSLNNASTTLRNVPDVAMEADFDNYNCELGSCGAYWGGTSFAAPRWAGFIALVNQQAVEAGTAPHGGIGFLNPALYAVANGSNYAADFHDTVSGDNLTDDQQTWYNAVPGYDLVTGWGSPTGQSLINDLAGKQLPGFWLSASSQNIAIHPGASATTTISIVNAGGFSGAVKLAISALPAGVTAKWGTNPTSGTSVLTLTAASTAAATATTLTITGTSGSITETTKIALTVHAPSFSIAPAPGTLDLGVGKSATTSVVVTPMYGFTGSVKLAVSGLPAGVTATLGTNPTSGSSTLTFTASSTAAVATTNITITGTSGSMTATTTLPLTVRVPTFELSNAGNINLGPGSSGSTFIWIADEFGFSGNVTFSVAGLPNGVTASFDQNPSQYSSALTLTASNSTALGSSAITVTGTSGSITKTTTFKLNVLAPAFSLAITSPINIGQGTTSTAQLLVIPQYGFTGLVNLAIAGLPSGVTASFSSNPASPGIVALMLTASPSAPLGISPITITGTSGSLKATATFALGVYVPTFTVSGSGPVALGQGSSAATAITVTPEYGFTGSVNLSVSGLPAGVTASISPNPATGVTQLTFVASSTATLGNTTVMLTGVSGTQTAKTTISLGVFQPAFTLTGPGTVTLGAGSSVSPTVTVNPLYGFTGSVNLSVTGLPTGVTAAIAPNPTSGSGAIALTATASAAPGKYTVTLHGTYGTKTVTTTFPLVVVTPSFTLSAGGPVQLGQGPSATTSIIINPDNGFTGTVSLTASGLPTGVTASFSPNPAIGYTVLTLTANSAAAIGLHTVTIKGVSGTQTATTTVSVTIGAPTFSLSAVNMTVNQGQTVVNSVAVNPLYGFTGSVNLSVTGLPTGVTAVFSPNTTNASSTLTISAAATATAGNYTLTLKGISGSKTVTTPLPLTVSAPSLTFSSPGSVTLSPGGNANTFLYINGASGTATGVNLTVTGLPSGVTAFFSPNPTFDSSLLVLTAAKTVVPGTSTLTITGTSGKLTASTTMQLQVQAPSFILSTTPTVSLAQGGTVTSSVNVIPNTGFSGLVNLVATGLPAGVTASWSPNPTTGYSTLTLTAANTAAIGSTPVTITGTSGSLTASASLQLSVVPPTFTLGGANAITVAPGISAPATVFVQWLNGFSANVNLSVSGLPSGVTASFSPASTSTSSTLTLSPSSTAALGQYNAVITGTYGTQTASIVLNITVAEPSFTVSSYGSPLTLGQGSSTTAFVAVNPQNGFNGSVNLSVIGLPAGVSATFSPNPTTNYGQITLAATNTASLGEYNATIIGTFGKLTASFPITVSVYSPSFTLSTQGPTVSPGASGQGSIYIQPLNGFMGSVSLSVSGLPAGATASFLPNPSADQSTLTINAASTAKPGQYILTVTGVSGKQTVRSIMPLTITGPSFAISAYGGQTLGQGQSVTVPINLSSLGGFNKPATLTASNLPKGVTASFSPNPAVFLANSTASFSTMTLTATSSASLGEYSITVTGTGGGMSVSTPATLTVAQSSFMLWGPQTVSLGPGTSNSQSVTVIPVAGFSGSVNLSVTGLPSGVSASFSTNPTSGTSMMLLTAASSAALGQYNAAVVGTSGTQSVTSPFVLTVAPPSFTLSSAYVNLGQGSSSTDNVWIYPNFGFSGQVSLSISGLPAGVTASFSPASTSTETTLTLTAGSTAAPGTYFAQITGTNGSTKATSLLTLIVGVPSFSLSTAGSVQLGQGTSAQASIFAYGSYTSSLPAITLTASGLPSGMTASFSPNPIIAASTSSVLTLTASSSLAPGNYLVTVTGTAGSQSSSTSLWVNVGAPTFTIYAWGNFTVGQGTSTPISLSVNAQNGFTGNVQFSVTGLPSGVTASISPNPTSGNATLTLTASSTATLGQYNITVTGTSGKITSSSTFPLAVYTPSFTLSGNNSVTVGRGSSATTYLYATSQYGFAGSIQFTASGLPSGVTASFSPNPSGSATTLTLTASSAAVLGDYKFIVTGTSGSQHASTIVSVAVYTPTFTIYSFGDLNIGQGKSISTYVNINPQYGFAGSVQFAVSGLPSGVTASFSPNPATSSTTLTLTASGTVSPGNYTVKVTGTSGSQIASTIFNLAVFVPTYAVSLWSNGMIGQGSTTTADVYVNPEYGFNGSVQFTVSGLPSGVTASFSPNPTTNNTTLTLTASSTAPVGRYTITVTGKSGSQSASATFVLGVFVPTFTLADYSYNITLSPGGTNQSYVDVIDEYGFSGAVQLAVLGLPSGVTASFSQNPATTSSMLTLTAGTAPAAGVYTLTITGTSGSQTASTALGLTVASQ